jgi:microcystin-dependent protein
LINQVGALKKATALQIASTLDLSPYLLKSGGTMTGSLVLYGNPSAVLEAATKGYVDTQDASLSAVIIAGLALCVAKAGDTMTGPLTLPGNPVSALQAAPKQYVDAQNAVFVPPGIVVMYGGSTPPFGWLECNGQSTAGYPALAAIYGSNVPDLRGEFIRGWDNGRGVDSGRAIGTTQVDAFKSHSHTVTAISAGAGGTFAYQWAQGGVLGGSNAQATGGTETRPRNVAMMLIVKT